VASTPPLHEGVWKGSSRGTGRSAPGSLRRHANGRYFVRQGNPWIWTRLVRVMPASWLLHVWCRLREVHLQRTTCTAAVVSGSRVCQRSHGCVNVAPGNASGITTTQCSATHQVVAARCRNWRWLDDLVPVCANCSGSATDAVVATAGSSLSPLPRSRTATDRAALASSLPGPLLLR